MGKVARMKLQYFGHVTRGSAGNLALTVLEGSMDGLRHQGRPKRQWMDDIVEWSGCSYIHLKEMSQDREQWRKQTIEWSSAVANRHRRWSTSESVGVIINVDDGLLILLAVTCDQHRSRRTCKFLIHPLSVGLHPSVLHGNSRFPLAFSSLVCYSGWLHIVPVVWLHTFFLTSLFLAKPCDVYGRGRVVRGF